MTRPEILRRLLQHGPMTRSAILDCTRWPEVDVDEAIRNLVRNGFAAVRDIVSTTTGRRPAYGLVGGASC